MAWQELYADVAALRQFIQVDLSDAALEAVADSVDQLILDHLGPHSGDHTVPGRGGFAVLQPRGLVNSVAVVPNQAFTATQELVTLQVPSTEAWDVNYTVDGLNEVKRRQGPFIELLKSRLGFTPREVSTQQGLTYSGTRPLDLGVENQILRRLAVVA